MYLGPFGRQKERHSLLTCPRAAALRIASTLKGVPAENGWQDYRLRSTFTPDRIGDSVY